MTEELQTAINQAGLDGIKQLLDWAQTTKEFAAEQAPLLAQEIVHWGAWSNGITAACWIILGIAAGICLWRFLLYAQKKTNIEEGDACLFFVLLAVCVVGLIFGINDSIHAAKPIVAPRLYLIETLADMTNGGAK